MNRLKFLLVLFIFLGIYAEGLRGQATIPQAQAIFLYNYTRFIEWPTDYKTGDFVIGVYGSEEVFTEAKAYTTGKSVGNQAIKVMYFSTVESIVKCHILFVAYGKTKEMQTILGMIGGFKTLIITEKPGALKSGSAINFVTVENKLKFEIKVSNATKIGLKIFSSMVDMAYAKY